MSSSSTYTSSEAPEHPLPSTPFFSIEYPGYVRSTSIPFAINNLGGQSSLENAFKRTATKTGDIVGTSNVLLKVVKRKRRRVDGQADVDAVGEYTAEAVGVVSKTVRFRSECHAMSYVNSQSECNRYGGLPVSNRSE